MYAVSRATNLYYYRFKFGTHTYEGCIVQFILNFLKSCCAKAKLTYPGYPVPYLNSLTSRVEKEVSK